MNFCPGCGMPQQGVTTPPMAPATAGPYPPVYPMPYMPSPFMYPPPITGRRATAIAGGIVMLVTGGMCLIAGLIFLLDSWWMTDMWLPLGILNMVAFSLSIVGAIGVFRRSWHVVIVVAIIVLLVVSIASMYDLGFFAVFILALAIVTVVLVAVSWSDTRAGRMAFYPPFPMMPPMGAGAPPPFMAPRINVRTANYDHGLPPKGPADDYNYGQPGGGQGT
jgi:hypothetical protein